VVDTDLVVKFKSSQLSCFSSLCFEQVTEVVVTESSSYFQFLIRAAIELEVHCSLCDFHFCELFKIKGTEARKQKQGEDMKLITSRVY